VSERQRGGNFLMTEQSMVENSAPTKHAVRIEWFQHDPVGGTIFVVPPANSVAKPVVDERGDGVISARD